jgi:hypothetical protein
MADTLKGPENLTLPSLQKFPSPPTLLTPILGFTLPSSPLVVGAVADDAGFSTQGTPNTLQDNAKYWTPNIWQGALLLVSISNQLFATLVSSNNTNTLTFASLPSGIVIANRVPYVLKRSPQVVPILKASIFNTALPLANTDILATDISPTNSPSYLRIYVTIAAAGQVYIRRKILSTTVSEYLNAANNLVANAAYMFDIAWSIGETVNIRYSVAGANILCLKIAEMGAAS